MSVGSCREFARPSHNAHRLRQDGGSKCFAFLGFSASRSGLRKRETRDMSVDGLLLLLRHDSTWTLKKASSRGGRHKRARNLSSCATLGGIRRVLCLSLGGRRGEDGGLGCQCQRSWGACIGIITSLATDHTPRPPVYHGSSHTASQAEGNHGCPMFDENAECACAALLLPPPRRRRRAAVPLHWLHMRGDLDHDLPCIHRQHQSDYHPHQNSATQCRDVLFKDFYLYDVPVCAGKVLEHAVLGAKNLMALAQDDENQNIHLHHPYLRGRGLWNQHLVCLVLLSLSHGCSRSLD